MDGMTGRAAVDMLATASSALVPAGCAGLGREAADTGQSAAASGGRAQGSAPVHAGLRHSEPPAGPEPCTQHPRAHMRLPA